MNWIESPRFEHTITQFLHSMSDIFHSEKNQLATLPTVESPNNVVKEENKQRFIGLRIFFFNVKIRPEIVKLCQCMYIFKGYNPV